MKVFTACLKKEALEQIRTGKFLLFTLIGIGMVILSFVTLVMMYFIAEMGIDLGNLGESFTPTFANGTMMFLSFMQSYFYIPVFIMTMSVVSKEISQKKWTLPISSGISPSHMIAAKFVVIVGSVLLASIISILLHFISTMLLSFVFMTPQISWQSDLVGMLKSYTYFIIFTIFIMTMLIAINAITKKGWPGITVVLSSVMVLPLVLGAISVGGTELAAFTPFYFIYEISKASYLFIPNLPPPSMLQYFFAYSTTILVMIIFVIWAIKSTKISKISA